MIHGFDTFRGKDSDYVNGPVKPRDHFPFGTTSIVSTLNGKILRLVSLHHKKGRPSYESELDSFRDIMVYAAFGYVLETERVKK